MKRIAYLFILVSSIVSSCDSGSNNTPLPVLQGRMMGDWIYIGENSFGSEWYIFSNVDVDSSNYIVNFKIELSSMSRESSRKYYDFVPYRENLTYLMDTTLNKHILDNRIILDSLSQNTYTSDLRGERWEHFQPNMLTYDAAPIAEMLYKESKRSTTLQTTISPNWGDGDWILYETLDDRCRYYKTDIKQTDSTYVVWRYTKYTKPSVSLLSAYIKSQTNVRFLSYGYVFKAEYKKSDKNQYRTVEGYYVDKFGTPILELEEELEYSEGDVSLQKILKKASK